jgi:hypothetical protein
VGARSAQGRDGVGGDLVERVGGVGDDGDPVAVDGQRRDADAQVDGRDGVLGEPADALHAGPRVGPAAVGEHVEEARPPRVGHLQTLADELDRVAGERRTAAGGDAGDERYRGGAVGEQLGAVAEQRGGAAPADRDGRDRVLVKRDGAGAAMLAVANGHSPARRAGDRLAQAPGCLRGGARRHR